MDTDDLKSSIPLLTSETFIEWKFKMKNYLRGKDLFDRVSGETIIKRDEKGRFIPEDKTWVNKALSILSAKIHRSLISTVTANGGEDDPIILWKNCMEFGSSEKNSNVFSAFRQLSNARIDAKNISGSILKVRDAIAELKALEIELNEQQLGHQLLDKIPRSLSSIQDAILASGQSDTPVTSELVLSMLDSKAKIENYHTNHLLDENNENLTKLNLKMEPPDDSSTALFTTCSNGRHNPKANHLESRCFHLHPQLRKQYNRNNEDSSPSAHLAIGQCYTNSDSIEAL